MAGALAEHLLDALFEALEAVVGDEGKRRAGKAAAMDADRALTVEQLFAQRERKGHVLMLGRTQRRDVLELEPRRAAGVVDVGQKRSKIVVSQRTHLEPDALILFKIVHRAQNGAVTGVRTQTRVVPADKVILATGGCSYPATGSTGDGYEMARRLGHTIIEPRGSLVPLVEKGHTCAAMQGLALKNVDVKLLDAKGKCVFEEFGELLFTHFGLSGPVILSASCHMQRGRDGYRVVIDLKPALDEKTLDARLLRDFAEFQNKDLANALVKLLPHSMIVPAIQKAGLSAQQKVNELTKAERRSLLETIKHFTIDIASCAPVEQAIVTSGGVKVSEVSPKTMESKLVKGLYFAGELLDVDAYTGGFNLQIAWATGRLAGSASAQEG